MNESKLVCNEGWILPVTPEPRKLYAIVRGDLPEGLRAAQMAHAVAGLVQRYPMSTNDWATPGNNYLIVLEVRDYVHLIDEISVMRQHSIPHYEWCEPDDGFRVTAIAAFPNPDKNWVFADLPLAYKPKMSWWKRLRG